VHADVTHVTHVKNAHAIAHCEMFGNQAAMLRILHRHVPAVEVDHLGAHLAMDGIQSGFSWDSDIGGNRQDWFLSAGPSPAGQTRKVNTTERE
jgi:hypothetical protein